MFGYLIASAPGLTPEELDKYKACYCGLCRCLKERHGELSRLTLNYDMSFLILLLDSLYDFEKEEDSKRCIAHPTEKRKYEISEATRYAADMLIVLSYFKCLDDWKDESALTGIAAAKFFEKKARSLKEVYPRQYASIEQGLFELECIEKENSDNADAACASFGHIMGEIFVYKQDRWEDNLYALGNALGRFIYLVDAAVDLKSDTIKGSYNPFRKYYGLDNYNRFKDILKMFLADAVYEFEKLPLIDNTGIMKNILCTGLWAKFEEKYGSL